MNITHVQLLSVPVADHDRAKGFYVNTLGFEVVEDQTMGEMRWLQVAPKGAATSMVLATSLPGVAPGGMQGLILSTADIDGDCARLEQAAVVVDGPYDLPWGRQATLSDPDGNGLVLAAAA